MIHFSVACQLIKTWVQMVPTLRTPGYKRDKNKLSSGFSNRAHQPLVMTWFYIGVKLRLREVKSQV